MDDLSALDQRLHIGGGVADCIRTEQLHADCLVCATTHGHSEPESIARATHEAFEKHQVVRCGHVGLALVSRCCRKCLNVLPTMNQRRRLHQDAKVEKHLSTTVQQ